MPTDKRMKYLARLEAKQTLKMTQEDRQAEFNRFTDELSRLGLLEETYEEIRKFMVMARDWLANGTVYQGVIPLVGLDRNLVYSLTNSKKHQVGVMLQSTKQAPAPQQPANPVNTPVSANPQRKVSPQSA